MKETIYTIPINDAFDSTCACALCAIEQRLDGELIEKTVGASMMEPDFRQITNQQGFCPRHYEALRRQQQALPLALVLQSHSQVQNDLLTRAMDQPPAAKKGLFQKGTDVKGVAQNVADAIDCLHDSCAICDKLTYQMERYTQNMIFLWKTEEQFRGKFASRQGFCLRHFALLLRHGINGLHDKDFAAFYQVIIEMEQSALTQMQQDITAFTKLFDHRTKGGDSPAVRNAIKGGIHLYGGVPPEQS